MDREPENAHSADTPSDAPPPDGWAGEQQPSNLTEIDPDEANKSGVYDTAGDREDHT